MKLGMEELVCVDVAKSLGDTVISVLKLARRKRSERLPWLDGACGFTAGTAFLLPD